MNNGEIILLEHEINLKIFCLWFLEKQKYIFKCVFFVAQIRFMECQSYVGSYGVDP